MLVPGAFSAEPSSPDGRPPPCTPHMVPAPLVQHLHEALSTVAAFQAVSSQAGHTVSTLIVRGPGALLEEVGCQGMEQCCPIVSWPHAHHGNWVVAERKAWPLGLQPQPCGCVAARRTFLDLDILLPRTDVDTTWPQEIVRLPVAVFTEPPLTP